MDIKKISRESPHDPPSRCFPSASGMISEGMACSELPMQNLAERGWDGMGWDTRTSQRPSKEGGLVSLLHLSLSLQKLCMR